MKKLTTEEFIKRAKKVHGDKYDYTQTIYRDARTEVEIICPKHGIFRQNPMGHLSGLNCWDCSYEHRKKPIYGKGINDLDDPVKVNGKMTLLYSNWFRMFQRCYGKIHSSAYEKCDVCDEWLYLSNFKEWFCEHYKEGWCLDKDILSGDKKIYSPQTCCFVPTEINVMFTTKSLKSQIHYDKTYKHYLAKVNRGDDKPFVQFFNTEEEAFAAYKREKELRIRELAEKWKGQIESRVYNAMVKYEVTPLF